MRRLCGIKTGQTGLLECKYREIFVLISSNICTLLSGIIIPLFLNSLNIFAENISFVELVMTENKGLSEGGVRVCGDAVLRQILF